jgi:hypothetical protein
MDISHIRREVITAYWSSGMWHCLVLLDLEDKVTMFLQSVRNYLHSDIVSHPRRVESWNMWKFRRLALQQAWQLSVAGDSCIPWRIANWNKQLLIDAVWSVHIRYEECTLWVALLIKEWFEDIHTTHWIIDISV